MAFQNKIWEICLLSSTFFLHSCLINLPLNFFSKLSLNKKGTNIYVTVIIYTRISTVSVILLPYIFIQIFFIFTKILLNLNYSWETFTPTLKNRLKNLSLYLPKLMVNSFGITVSLLGINCIAFRGVAPWNLVAYANIAEEYIILSCIYFWNNCSRGERMLMYRISNEEIQIHGYRGWIFYCVTHFQVTKILKWPRFVPNLPRTSNFSLHSIGS
jgi:hypothetical protein